MSDYKNWSGKSVVEFASAYSRNGIPCPKGLMTRAKELGLIDNKNNATERFSSLFNDLRRENKIL